MQLAQYGSGLKFFRAWTPEQLDPVLGRTFGSFEGQPLTFTSPNQPMKRCLSFHAIQAVRRAKNSGWLSTNWQADQHQLEYMSEGGYREVVETWLKTADLKMP